MPVPTRTVLIAGTILFSSTLAHAGERAAFDTDLRDSMPASIAPIVKPAPTASPDLAAAPDANGARRRHGRVAKRAQKAERVAAARPQMKPSLSDGVAGTTVAVHVPAGDAAPPAPSGNTEAAERTPGPPAAPTPGGPREAPSGTLAEMLARHARANGVPVKLAQAVVTIESRGNARASNAGALGLMQIKYGTARAAGFSGPAVGLFVADTNLRYGMKVLGQAYKAAGGDTCGALMRYQSGHLSTHMSRANQVYCSRARAIMAGA